MRINDGDPDDAGIEVRHGRGGPNRRTTPGKLPWVLWRRQESSALVRSPDALFVYWEITDDAIALARGAVSVPAGVHGWCNLRVYDTTARDFDGTNANSYFDVTVDRSVREFFLDLRKPTAAFHVEIGIKTHEGYFQTTIARPGRAELPRGGRRRTARSSCWTVTCR